jgi:hypothetical protein
METGSSPSLQSCRLLFSKEQADEESRTSSWPSLNNLINLKLSSQIPLVY